MAYNKILRQFFEEKDLPEFTHVVNHNGTTHIIDSERIQEIIVNETPESEQKDIYEMIVKIDFKNGDVNHFL
ncbi:hypothetical protein, partial [Mycobacterium tuberculosis]|uniref:hypothetical protein n=1 Tax=Mycobacterium tuberculosis TaxID=1773 RepID=UPI00158710CA